MGLRELSLTEIAGMVAAGIAVTAAIPYSWKIVKGYRPSYATWIVWAVVGLTAFLFHIRTGAWDSLWLPMIYAVVPLWYLFLLWYLKADWVLDRTDKACLIGAVASWAVWVVTEIAAFSMFAIAAPLIAIVITDAFGSIPTVRRAKLGEEYENRLAWGLASLATAINLFAIENWRSAEVIYPVYLTGVMTVIAVLAMTYRRPKSVTVGTGLEVRAQV